MEMTVIIRIYALHVMVIKIIKKKVMILFEFNWFAIVNFILFFKNNIFLMYFHVNICDSYMNVNNLYLRVMYDQ